MKSIIKLFSALIFISLVTGINSVMSQSVGIAGSAITPDAESILDIQTTTKGVLLPRMTTAQRTGISPTNTSDAGLMVYDTDTESYWYWDGASPTSGWKEIPNSGDIPTVGDFIVNGTTQQVGANFNIDGDGTIANLTANGNIILAGSSRDLKAADNFDIQGTSGINIQVDSDANSGNTAFRILNDVSTELLKLEEEGDIFFSGLALAGTNILQADVNGQVTRSTIDPSTIVTGSGTLNYVSKWTPNDSTLGNGVMYDDGSNVGIGTGSPDDKLDVVGSAQVSTYLKVGNPAAPTAVSSSQWHISYWEEFDNWSYWTQSTCRGSNSWYVPVITTGYIYYEHENNNDDDYAYSPYIWVPSNSDPNNIRARWNIYVCMETGYDGIRAQLSINGGTWTEIQTFVSGGYNSNADDNCGAGPFKTSWSTSSGVTYSPVVDLDSYGVEPGDWVRVRLESSTDGSSESCFTDAEVYWFTLDVVNQTNTAGFETGGVYAAGHIFAHSNSHVGDVAEYFPVDGPSEPGDLIAMDPNRADVYMVSEQAYNPYVIGVYSTAPSVLVNSPEAGEPVGLSGRVPVKVVAENGAIKVGDYLTSSSKKGHAMKATKSGYTIGRALENMDKETGTVLCLIEPGWYNPNRSGNTSGGSFFIGKGEKQVVVNDPSMIRDSRVFVSMLGNAGSPFWISEKENGRFAIKLDEAVASDVQFDYFIDNANPEEMVDTRPSGIKGTITSYAGPEAEKVRSNDVLIDVDGKKLTAEQLNDTSPKEHAQASNSKELQVMIESDWVLPAPPPNQEKSWIWHPDYGYVETGKR